MKKETTIIVIALLAIITVALVVIAVTLMSTPRFYQIDEGTLLPVENNALDLQQWKITPMSIELSIMNRGQQEYIINAITIPTCGTGDGGSVNADYQPRTFSVECTSNLTEGAPFIQDATITYHSVARPDAVLTTRFMLSGNVLTRKCFYEIVDENTPYAHGSCRNTADCTRQLSAFIDLHNQERSINNKAALTTNDVSVVECSYSA